VFIDKKQIRKKKFSTRTRRVGPATRAQLNLIYHGFIIKHGAVLQ